MLGVFRGSFATAVSSMVLRLKYRMVIGRLDFSRRFRSSTLVISDDGTGRCRARTREPRGAPQSANLICV
ncbi:hypothetical protein RMSM_01984 [Rhodopirellula maiorica SM1]|uniref:Uncharacterized protein n=1 Tax=Rhodopirellula maiorica SM1 TaxID=1265738 RepID=M5S086_9BACT|nr:hypothetical protein RMSM_01984 [Rhodopirellula maiorica SM1]